MTLTTEDNEVLSMKIPTLSRFKTFAVGKRYRARTGIALGTEILQELPSSP